MADRTVGIDYAGECAIGAGKGETPVRVAIVLFVIVAQVVVARASKERRRKGMVRAWVE